MKDAIHVVLSADDNYAKYLAVTIVSILCNRVEGDNLYFHILDGGIRRESQNKIINIVQRYGANIEFIAIDHTLFANKELNIRKTDHISIASYYRLFIPSLLKLNRCIYMDCDIICQGTLSTLWQTNLNNKIIGAVVDVSEEDLKQRLGVSRYFNSGVLLLDLEAMRSQNIQNQFIQFIEEQPHRIRYHDQDVVNAVLEKRIHELDKTWNCQVCKTHSCKEKGFHSLSKKASVLHYIGRKKPWIKGCRAPSRQLYWKYLNLTPWKPNCKDKIKFFLADTLYPILKLFI